MIEELCRSILTIMHKYKYRSLRTMINKSTISSSQLILPYMENFQKNFADIKSKSSLYLKTYTENFSI